MGKIRIKTLGIEELEKEQTQKAKKRKQAKEAKKMAKGAHGGERVVSMAPTEEEIAQEIGKPATTETPFDYAQGKQKEDEAKKAVARKVSKKAHPVRSRSKRYRDALIQVDRARLYPLSEAVLLLKKIGAPPALRSETAGSKTGGFDGTVELHINTIEKGVSGQVTLPHGTGKTVRVTIADPASDGQFDKLIDDIEKGVIDFDVLIATSSAMPKLAKVAKILGPRGLMPNPKNGTISDDPKRLALSFAKGQTNFRTESQAPIIHATVGKVSFAEKDLEENIASFLKAIGTGKIQSVTLKSTMSPGIKVDFSSLT